MRRFGVNHWGSHPEAGNDDCYSGEDFDNFEQAINHFWTDPKDSSVSHIELFSYVGYDSEKGCDTVEPLAYRNNPNFMPKGTVDYWRHEQAVQAGMLFGIEAYNSVMGWE